jgi:hypothetical protein
MRGARWHRQVFVARPCHGQRPCSPGILELTAQALARILAQHYAASRGEQSCVNAHGAFLHGIRPLARADLARAGHRRSPGM